MKHVHLEVNINTLYFFVIKAVNLQFYNFPFITNRGDSKMNSNRFE